MPLMYLNLLVSRKFSNLVQTHHINSKIKILVQQGLYLESLKSYAVSTNFPLNATKFTFPSLLKACALLTNYSYGKTIHATIITLGLQFDPFIATSLINMYVKCGSLSNALQVFDNLSERYILAQDVTIWNSLIDGYFRYGFVRVGLSQFRRMQEFGVKPDGYSLSIVIAVSNGVSSLEGKKIHGYIVRNMFDYDPFLMTALVDMYSSCGRPREAWRVFEKLEDKQNTIAWNSMIGGFLENGIWRNSLELYSLMKEENCEIVSTTFSSTLTACSSGKDLSFGKQVHCDVIKKDFQNDAYVCTSLLTMYAKCCSFEDTKKVFGGIPNKEVELWNAMISACIGNDCAYDALEVYNQMKFQKVAFDSFTMSNILASCSTLGLHDFGMALHGDITKTPLQASVHVQTSLLHMYLKCGATLDAQSVFYTMQEKDLVAWGSLISGFCQNSKFSEALDLFKEMNTNSNELKPDSDIMASVISACVGVNIELGFIIHGFVVKTGMELDPFVCTSLIDMYSKFGSPKLAECLFFELPKKNLVTWNSMISCYTQNSLPELSISLLPQIVHNGLHPDSVTITSVLAAVSSMAALLRGKTIHAYAIKLKIPFDIQVKNALIDMYIKCGFLGYSQKIFKRMSRKNIVTWNSLISGYGSHGECLKAINLFKEMTSSGFVPDDVTFLSLISSCNHSGFLEEGLGLFNLMQEYGIEVRMAHYVNIVDLMGRSGRLIDAYDLINKMPIEADRSVWLCLLSACRVHRNIEIGEVAGDKLFEIEPSRGSNYVQLLNLYLDCGLQEKAANLRGLMKQKGLKKVPGCSWIEVKDKVNMFFSGDCLSESTVEIHQILYSLGNHMRKSSVNENLINFE